MKEHNHIQLLRHATLVLQLDGRKLLVDPMFSAREQLDPVANCGNDRRIPMVELPIDKEQLSDLIREVDAVLVTHIHRDHWDVVAQQMISRDKRIYCQPVDAGAITHQGFVNVLGIEANTVWNGWQIARTGGHHGTGEIEAKMGKVSGFVLSKGSTRIYVAGDTIWCGEVAEALRLYRPSHIVLNTGAAKFLTGDPITMTADDVFKVCRASANSKVIAVHMDSVNHCFLTRTLLKEAVDNEGVAVSIPADGEVILLQPG